MAGVNVEPVEHLELEHDGLRFHLAVAGDGPLVVLAHGFPGLWWSWRHQLPALAAAGYRAVALDQRGFGGTDAPPTADGYGHDRTITDLLAIADHFGEERAVFVGHDVGGPQTWELARAHPERVRGVAVLSTPYEPARSEVRPTEAFAALAREHFLHRHWFQAVGPADAELAGDVRGFLRRVHHVLSADGDYRQVWAQPSAGNGYLDVLPRFDGELPWLPEADLDVFVDAYQRTGFTGGLGWYRNADRNWELKAGRTDWTIRVPALFVAGVEDPVPGMARAGVLDRMAEAVPDLRIERVPGAGHWVQQEQPDAVNRLLVEFLVRLRGTGPGSGPGGGGMIAG